MAIRRCKGTVLQMELATVFTAIAQIIGMDLPEGESETFEADTLDNADAGIPYEPTGRSEGGSLGFDMFWDPSLSGHQALTDLLTTPAKQNYKLITTDTEEEPFTGSGIKIGRTVALSDGLKARVEIKVNKLPTYPT